MNWSSVARRCGVRPGRGGVSRARGLAAYPTSSAGCPEEAGQSPSIPAQGERSREGGKQEDGMVMRWVGIGVLRC